MAEVAGGHPHRPAFLHGPPPLFLSVSVLIRKEEEGR
jgi:hypothetical protein